MAKLRKQTWKPVYGERKKIKILLAPLGSVRIGKNCDLELENAALGLWPQAAFSTPRSQFFPIWTSQLANNIYVCNLNRNETRLPKVKLKTARFKQKNFKMQTKATMSHRTKIERKWHNDTNLCETWEPIRKLFDVRCKSDSCDTIKICSENYI